MNTLQADVIVIGGGIVGLATTYQILKKYPSKKVIVLEKEKRIAAHQTGRNSGVIHSGIYYKPGSFKATNCRRGKKALEQFCTENNVPFQKVGKLIVATDSVEEGKLLDIYQRGKDNEIDCKLLTKEEMLAIEPNVSGVCGIHVPETGIVDYKKICDCLVDKINNMGGHVFSNEKVMEIKDNLVQTNFFTYKFKTLINCAGIYADHIAELAGHKPSIQIVPFRGEYYTLSSEAIPLVRGLIYPVPDPRFPFLGVHFTKMIDGGVECGPNAVLAFGRESYNKYQINFSELLETLMFSGFWKLCFKYWRTGLQEMIRSFSKKLYAGSLQKLVPAIQMKHLVSNRPSGIRAQAINKDGTLVDDFLIEKQGNIVHVLNAPSPAATACLTIGEQILSKLSF
jgi:L-2-hydroxyglutarate oxidase